MTSKAYEMGNSPNVGFTPNLEIEDEGSPLVQQVQSINFVGPGVEATSSGKDVTVTITPPVQDTIDGGTF